MNRIKKIKEYYNWGGRFLNDKFHKKTSILSEKEINKRPFRYDVINYLLSSFNRNTNYLEIGVRNPDDNYNKIISNKKYSVDPGIEFKDNPVDFKMTSDIFFSKLKSGEILKENIKFDVIFIDGLHLAEQVEKDIINSLDYIKNDGFIVLHDCNPPSEWHARETHKYEISPAMQNWNGTTWKAFLKQRNNPDISSCCIDSDFGIGILTKGIELGCQPKKSNPFYEYSIMDENRFDALNLLSFKQFKVKIEKKV